MSLYLGENKIADNTCSRNIGEIITSSIPLSDAGLHLLDGAVISSAGSYTKFVNYIAGLVSNYPDLFVSENDWQTAVTNYGVCGKFVYDSVNNTVRLPKITGFVEGTTDVTALGNLVEAGLPNITGRLGVHPTSSSTVSGAFYPLNGFGYGLNNDYTGNTAGFDASRSNSIYGNSSTVQPQAIKVLYYIVIASSITNELNLDVAELFNSKADRDLNNLNQNGLDNFYYKSGDVLQIKDYWGGGIITDAGKQAITSYPLPKSTKYINGIIVNKFLVSIRKVAGGYLPSLKYDYLSDSEYELRITIKENYLTIKIIKSAAFDTTNNTPVGIELNDVEFQFT